MINGHMAEAQKGFAIIEDVGDDTFVRFIQWAYNGYYDAAKYELDTESRSLSINQVCDSSDAECAASRAMQAVEEPALPEKPAPEELALADEPAPVPEPQFESFDYPSTIDWGGFTTSKKSRNGKKVVPRTQVFWIYDESPIRSSKEQLEKSFIKRKETVRKNLMSIPPRRNCKPNEDYSEVFLCHARLYVFAEKYDIQPLKDLALEELQATLAIFTLYQERTGDVISLLRYIYANTGEPVKGVEDMRTLLTHYVGCKMDTLMKDDNFRELMIEDGGALLGDFMKMVGKRLY